MQRWWSVLLATVLLGGCLPAGEESSVSEDAQPLPGGEMALDGDSPAPESDAEPPAPEPDAADPMADAAPPTPDADVPDMAPPPPPPPPPPSTETVFMLPIAQGQADWRDLAFLALVPASAHANNGRPVVIALREGAPLGDSAEDFLRRFEPSRAVIYGAPSVTVETEIVERPALTDLTTATVSAAAAWETADRVVLAPEDDYGHAVMASSLAALLDAPLFFVGSARAPAVDVELARLSPSEILVVGDADAAPEGSVSVTSADEVIEWLAEQGIDLDYVAVVNPNDRTGGRSQKLSLTAPVYTARHDGLVVATASAIPPDPATGRELGKTLRFLQGRYETLGHHPEHLALVGSFDVIPVNRTNSLFDVPEREWPVNDLPYGELDDDPFREIAVGRIFTDSIYRGSLLAARSVTYEMLMDGTWENRFIESGLWGFDELRAIMLNVGFEPPAHLTEAQINQNATLEASAILHKDHSHCTVLGNAFDVSTPALYAPAVVLSRGCSVAGLDLVETAAATVPGRMLGRGAIAFVGAPRNSIAGNTVTEVAFFNHVLAGQTLGQAMRSGFNNATVHYLDEGQDAGMRYVLDNEMLFGDPGLRFHVPSAPMTALATATRDGDVVTVTGPEEWTQVQFVPEQLAEWNYEGDLFMYVGPGAEPKTYWSGRYDNEDLYYTVALPLESPVRGLSQMDVVAAPLGWRGGHYLDTHQDGTHTLRWRVRLLDYGMETGVIAGQVDRAEFRLEP